MHFLSQTLESFQWQKWAVLTLAVMLFAAFSLAEQARAQANTSAVPFLRIEPDSRSAGMGNTGVALADNANAIFWNPAGLGYQHGAEVGLTHSTWLPEFNADLFYEYLVGKYSSPELGTFGAHITFLNLGEHERRDASNNLLGEFRSYELAAGLSYGRQLTEDFSIGGGVRFIYSDLADETAAGDEISAATSVAFDIGGLYRTDQFELAEIPTTFSAGFNLANMGPHVSYRDQDEPLPMNLRVGYAFTFEFDEYNTLTFANDFNKMLTNVELEQQVVDGDTTFAQQVDPFYQALFTGWSATEISMTGDPDQTTTLSPLNQITVGAGLEYWYDELFALRTGYFYEHPDNGNRQTLNFGAGLRYNIVGIDFSYVYALQEAGALTGTMRFSLMVDIP